MELTKEEVHSIAELAKLDLTEDELTLYAGQLSEVFDYFQRLQELDTSHIEPTASVLPLKNVLRPDVSSSPLPPEQAIANAPDAEAHQFRVSAVLDEE
ncbi:MAG: Asp-tRNA(Asn)/Glu-tRNA(Gln) amidotransferase subunit GatC [Anaerolineae bacterium]|nr:Asp-tRNA(Asn)/Glu-tRNA(Gln) amidotransferase subunit GatC [Anaerolineae bacterium]